MTTSTTTNVVLPSPDGFAVVVDVSDMTLAELDAESSEESVEDMLNRARYLLAVTALTVYTRVSNGEKSGTIIPDLAPMPNTKTPRPRQYVSRLALIGEAVSHGVTDTLAFRTAMRGMKVTDVRALINEHVDDDGTVDEADLIAAMTTPAKAEQSEKTEQEAFANRIKSASQTIAKAASQFGADDADVVITDEIRAMLAVISDSVATLTA